MWLPCYRSTAPCEGFLAEFSITGIHGTEVSSVKADREMFTFVLPYLNQVQTYAQNFTSYKNLPN